ncbi:MAG TPA: DUF1007 family protein [Dongiaceae bacterium]|nr:DUF1007 family protein [Dongiaceae bacterium]
MAPLPFVPMRACALVAILSLCVLGFARPAAAHPHVFIDNTVNFVFDAGKITGFRLTWVFDDVFSDELLNDFDANHDKNFDAGESKKIAATIWPNMQPFHYFTYLWIDKKDQGEILPTDFKASASKGIVTFDFLVPLPKPVDPKTQPLAVEIYDHEFYVEVDLHKTEPVRFTKMDGISCTPHIRDDTSHAYFGGYVNPQEITLTCK